MSRAEAERGRGPLSLGVRDDDPTPAFEQLRGQLAGLVATGALRPGDRLPPLRQLAGDLGLAVGTVARTYRELEAAGLVVSRRGGGTRVADSPATARPRGMGERLDDLAGRFVEQALGTGADAAAVTGAVERALVARGAATVGPRPVAAAP